MFQVYADQVLIYDDTNQDKEQKLINPKLSISDSAAGSFTMTVPPGNAGYNTIVRMKTDITIMKEGEIYWQGRVLQENMDFWNQRVMTCEGELAFLNDTIQPPHEYDYNNQQAVRLFLSSLLTNHNAKVESNRQFTLGTVTVYAPNDTLYRTTNYESTISCVNEKLVSKLGGHLIVRHQNGVRYLDYLEDAYNLNTQTVDFGKNLIDFTRSFDSAEYATVIVPLGKRLEKEEGDPDIDKYLTVESVNSGSIYVQSETAVSNYGWIVKVVHFDDVENASTLLSMGQSYLSDIQFDSMVIELSALDLHYLNPNIESVKLGDSIRVISEPHGLDKIFPVQKMEIPLDKPENTLFMLGSEIRLSLTSENNKVNQELKEKIENIETVQSEVDPDAILTQAQENAAALMSLKLNGYVTLETTGTGQNEYASALYVSESKPVKNSQGQYQARRFWRWNLNGLGYTDDYGSTWKTAITMDGTILGERIAANSIHGNRITTGTLTLVTSAGDTGCMIYLRTIEGGTTTTISSSNIQINGMVTFSNLTDPDTTSGGTKTFIDGGHIKAETMDLSSLRVRTVWYNDPTNQVDYTILASETEGSGYPSFVYLGPKDRTYNAANYLYLYGNDICFGRPGDGDDLTHESSALEFNLFQNIICGHSTASSRQWHLGTDSVPFGTVCTYELHLGEGYGTLYATRGTLFYEDSYGDRYEIQMIAS